MSALEWAGMIAGSTVAGGALTKLFDWQVTRATARKTNAEETKIDADAAKVIADTAVTLVAPLQAQVLSLSDRLDTVENEHRATKTRLQVAIGHITELRLWIGEHLPDKHPPEPPEGLGI